MKLEMFLVCYVFNMLDHIFSGVNRQLVEAEKPQTATSNVLLGRFQIADAVGDDRTSMGQNQVRFPSLKKRIEVEKTGQSQDAEKPFEARIEEKGHKSQIAEKPVETRIEEKGHKSPIAEKPIGHLKAEQPAHNPNEAKQRVATVEKVDQTPTDGKWIRNSLLQTNPENRLTMSGN